MPLRPGAGECLGDALPDNLLEQVDRLQCGEAARAHYHARQECPEQQNKGRAQQSDAAEGSSAASMILLCVLGFSSGMRLDL